MAVDIARRINSGLKLPVFSLTSRKALFLLAQEDVWVQELAQVISGDQVLASNVIRLVNSASTGISRNITSVSEAITFIGLERTRSIIYAAEAQALFGNTQTIDDWRHAISCAYAAERIAAKVGADKNAAFMSGLVHDIGKFYIGRTFPSEYDIVHDGVGLGEEIEQVEKEFFGMNHAEVGGLLLKKWNFPQQVVDAVSSHCIDDPGFAGDILSQILIVANYIAHKTNPDDGDFDVWCGGVEELADVKLTETEIAEILTFVQKKVSVFMSKISVIILTGNNKTG